MVCASIPLTHTTSRSVGWRLVTRPGSPRDAILRIHLR